MFEDLRFRMLESKVKRKYLSDLKKAPSEADKEHLHAKYFHDVHDEIETSRRFLKQEQLLAKAQRFLVDKPAVSNWETAWDGTRLIKLNVLNELNNAIRKEQKAKRDF